LSYDRDKMLSTVKMVDYGKYMYNKGKEEKEKRKKQKVKEMKEIKIKYGIGDNDLRMKIDKSIEFLHDGHSVKFTIRLKGRERIYADKAKEKLVFVSNQLSSHGRLASPQPKEEA
jgi:translation initiation factor IF-3